MASVVSFLVIISEEFSGGIKEALKWVEKKKWQSLWRTKTDMHDSEKLWG